MTTTARRHTTLGAYGEACAARHLLGQGMVLLDRNWRCPTGEIDLVLRDAQTLVVCEVKTRSSLRWGSPLEAVGEEKAGRLRALAALWQEARGLRVPEVRIDLVGILLRGGAVVALDHVKAVG